jgi:cytochrome bd ubiquinol oxidase subunit II
MLGSYITGFQQSLAAQAFALLIALCLPAGYALLGAGWLILKTQGTLQLRAVRWAELAWWGAVLGIAAVSVASPLVSARIFEKWFALPYVVLLSPVPLATLVLLWITRRSLLRMPVRLAQDNQYGAWVPFGCAVGVVLLGFYGLAYSLFPYLVVDRISIWDAASAPESLFIILWGAVVVLPAIAGYTVYAYRVFGGKVRPLTYG